MRYIVIAADFNFFGRDSAEGTARLVVDTTGTSGVSAPRVVCVSYSSTDASAVAAALNAGA